MKTSVRKPFVLITGGSKGIGLATAQVLLERGCRVGLLARGEPALAAARAELVAAGHADADIHTASIDLGASATLAADVLALPWLEDRVDGLVNNAAVEIVKTFVEFTPQEMEQHWRVNMLAPMLLIQALHGRLKAAKGAVVNISSVADTGWYARYSVYGASKAFLHSFTRHVARELGYDGIRINVVSPGGVATPLMAEVEKQFSEEHVRTRKAGIPMEQRWGHPREIGETIHFALFGPRYLHGADLRIDGAM